MGDPEFPRRGGVGAPTPESGEKPIICQVLCQKLPEKERNLTGVGEGGTCLQRPPAAFDQPMVMDFVTIILFLLQLISLPSGALLETN